MPLDLMVVRIFLFAVNGVPGLRMSRRSGLWQRIAATLTSIDSVAGLIGAFWSLSGAISAGTSFPWPSVINSVVGLTQHYVLFIVLALVLLLGTLVPFRELIISVLTL